VTAVEGMAFCKIMLNSYIYFHQKVLAADAIINDFSFYAIKQKLLNHPCDFLKITDQTIWDRSFLNKKIDNDTDKKFSDLLEAIRLRRLPKRALVVKTMYIDDTVVKETETDKHYKAFTEKVEEYCKSDAVFGQRYAVIKDHLESTISKKEVDITFLSDTERGQISEQLKNIARIREGIFEIANRILEKLQNDAPSVARIFKSFEKYDMCVCFRDAPGFSSEEIVVVDYDNEPRSPDDIMPLGPWTKSFAANKWAGYIFAGDDLVPLINVATRMYLQEEYIPASI
jgi:HD superfamily phosphohydrolase